MYFRHKHAFWLFSDCGTLSRVEQVCQAYHEVQYCLSLTAVNEGASSYIVIKDVLLGHFFTEPLRNQSTVSDDKVY